MKRVSFHSLFRPLVSLLSRLATRFHSTLSFDSPLSISCTLCNYFTALGYYPFNLLIYALFTHRTDGWQHCADLMRYQLALLLLFVLYVAWRWALSTSGRGVRDGSLLVLVALQLWVDWHGWWAGKQAVANFQAWSEADDEEWRNGLHTAIDHSIHSHTHLPIHPPPLAHYWPSFPYQLGEQCGVGFTIHLVRLVLINVAFTAAVALAFVIRIGGERVSEERKERVWAVWDGGVEWVERQWNEVKRRARRVKRRYQRQQQQQRNSSSNGSNGSSSRRSHYGEDSDSDSDGEYGASEEDGGANGHTDGVRGMSVKERLLP